MLTPKKPSLSGSEDVTTELPVTGEAARRAPRDLYQKRRETLAAALLVGGALLIWSQIGETATAVLGR